jgi:hypothetical protein
MLYEKAKIKNEVNKLMYQKNNQLKEEHELSKCTFKPKLLTKKKSVVNTKRDNNNDNNDNNERIHNHYHQQLVENESRNKNKKENNLYNRTMYWKNKTNEKYIIYFKIILIIRIAKEKISKVSKEEGDKDLTFRPMVCYNLIFYL